MNTFDGSALQRFQNAVDEMAGSGRSIQERLGSAVATQLLPLRAGDLPPSLRERFTSLMSQLEGRGGIEDAARALSDEEAGKLIEEVVSLTVRFAKAAPDEDA